MRIVGSLTLVAIVVLARGEQGGLQGFHRLLSGIALVYPHLSRWLATKLARPRPVELGTSLVDDFLLGATIYTSGFSPVPTSSLLTIALANGMALGGPRWMTLAGVGAALGATVAMPFLGVNFMPRAQLEVDLTAAGSLLLYFTLFAYTAWSRSLALIRSRRRLRQENLAAEIATKKAEALLYGALPPEPAQELRARGEVTARRLEEAALIAVRVEPRTADGGAPDATALFAEANRVFKALDAIAERLGLEPVRTTVTGWLAIGGVAGAAGGLDEAAAAALEILELSADASLGRPAPRICAAIDSGWVAGGLIEARRFGFALWGPAAERVERLAASASAGEVWATAECATKLGAKFRVEPAATAVTLGEGREISPVRILHGETT